VRPLNRELQGGFKIRDGVNRTQSGNLVIGARLADPQIAGFSSTVLSGNTVIDTTGQFFSCVGDAFGLGTKAERNTYYGASFKPGCAGACDNASFACWQQDGRDAGSTFNQDLPSAEAVLLWAGSMLGGI